MWQERQRTVPARDIGIRDAIMIGGRTRRVTETRAVHGGVQLKLHTGEMLIAARGSRFEVVQRRWVTQPTQPLDHPDAGCGCERPCPGPDGAPAVQPAAGDTPRLTVGLTDQCHTVRRGECWRCDTPDVPVIWLGPVQLPGLSAPFMACQPCTQRLHDRAQAYTAART